jgi:hypothetical protein
MQHEIKRTGSRFTLAMALAVVMAIFHGRALASAGKIDTISPSCARVGAQVKITGNGFGAMNVAVTVGGVAAQVISANGNSATFVVPGGLPLGATTVTAVNPGVQTGSIAFGVCDLLVSSAWGGEWQMATTYSLPSGGITAVDNITAFIRDNEPLGLNQVPNLGSCTGSISDTRLQVQCSGQTTTALCTLNSSQSIAVDLNGDRISGSGSLALTFSGSCGILGSGSGAIQRNIQIAGNRISADQNPSGPPTTLVQSFIPGVPFVSAGP